VAKGKLVFMPPAHYALNFPETKYLELADTAALDVGTGDFSISCIFYLDSTVGSTSNSKLLVGKGPWDLANVAGWWAGVMPNNTFVRVKVNDGNATALTIDSDNAAFNTNEWYWLHISFDRDGNVSMWLGRFSTGVLANIKTGAISTRANTWSNSNALWMGNWGATANRYFKGNISFVRLDIGRLLPQAWIEEEWLRVKWGLTRKIQDFTACWPFDESLVDLSSAGYTPSYLPSGTPTYVSGYPTGYLTYNFLQNIGQELERGHVPHFQVERAKDGTAYAYGRTVKRRLTLTFKLIALDQLYALQAASEGAQPVKIHLDATHAQAMNPDYIMEEPMATARPMPNQLYDLSLPLEEA